MKITIVLILFIFLKLSSFAQTNKKQIMLGGGVTYLKTKSLKKFGADPQLGYFIQNRLLVGTGVSPFNSVTYKAGTITQYTTKRDTVDKYFKNNGTISPFIKYFIGKSKVRLFIQDSFDLFVYRTNVGVNEGSVKKINIGNTISGGLAFFFTKRLGGEISYNQQLFSGRFAELPLEQYPYLKFGVGLYL